MGQINVHGSRHGVALCCHQAMLEIDLVRVTAIEPEEVYDEHVLPMVQGPRMALPVVDYFEVESVITR